MWKKKKKKKIEKNSNLIDCVELDLCLICWLAILCLFVSGANGLQTKYLTLYLFIFFFGSYFVRFTVKKRIDRTQSRLDKLSNQELLLEAAHALRIERERQKELQTQLVHQTQDIQRASTVSVNQKKKTEFRIGVWHECAKRSNKTKIERSNDNH